MPAMAAAASSARPGTEAGDVIAVATQAAYNFLSKHSHVQSLQAQGALHGPLVAALRERDATEFFLVPVRANLLAHEKALLWMQFVWSAPFPAAFYWKDSEFPKTALALIAEYYDLAHENLMVDWAGPRGDSDASSESEPDD